MPSNKNSLRIGLAVVSLLFIFTALQYKIHFFDFWIHLAAGRYNLTNGLILKHDVFTFSQYGVDWRNHEWLYQIFLYLGYLLLGFAGIVPLNALFICGLFYIVYKGLKIDSVKDSVLAWLLLIVALNGCIERLNVRPHIWSLFFTLSYLYILQRHADGKLKYPYYLAPLQALWVNLHGGTAFLGYFYCGTYIFEATVRLVLTKDISVAVVVKKRVFQLSVCLALLLLFSLANPHGYRIITYPFAKMQQAYQISQIDEWQSLTISILGIALPLMYLLLLCSLPRMLARQNFGYLIVNIFFAALTFRYARFRTELLLISIWPAHQFLRTLEWKNLLGKTLHKIVVSALFIIMICDLMINLRANSAPGIGVSWERYPKQASRFINANLPGKKLINPYHWGGFLNWYLDDNLLFIDGRQLPGETVFSEYDALYNASVNQRETLKNISLKYGADLALWDFASVKGGTLENIFMAKDWGLIYFDRVCLLYLRRNEQNSELLSKFEYQIVNPAVKAVSFLQKARSDKRFAMRMVTELNRIVTNDPQNSFALIALANHHSFVGNWPAAEDALRKILVINKKSAPTWQKLGLVLQKRQKNLEAEKCFKKAREIDPAMGK